MRASTLFGLTIAILIGMAVVFGVKSAGLFSRTTVAPPAPDRPRVLVPRSTMFEGLTYQASDVMVRVVDDSELDQYMKNKHKYMPALPEAVNFRTMARNVGSNEPLLRDHFKDIGLPGSFGELLEPGQRAVNLQIPRERAGGGVIRKNDYVDVLLTTSICSDPSCIQSKTATAPIAMNLKVILKRDSIFTTMVADDPNKPMSFTLQANPYRAALIEFSKSRGLITLVPTGPAANKGKLLPNNESKDEERRIMRINEQKPITDADLEEIFRLASIPLPPPPSRIDAWVGNRPVRQFEFPNAPGGYGAARPTFQSGDGGAPLGYYFQPPADSVGPKYVPCASCPGGKRPA